MELWQEVLAQLQLQMTVATYNAWLRTTTAVQSNNTLTVTVQNEFALDWIKHRLGDIIQRTVNRITSEDFTLIYTLPYQYSNTPDEPAPNTINVQLIEFDPTRKGWVQTANYAIRFWQPYLTCVPFAVWLTLRSFAFYADRDTWPSIQTLADTCTNGNRHAILGRAKRAERCAQPGALSKLETERIVYPRTVGTGSNTSYIFRVLASLPLLTPIQVDKLSPRLQQSHVRFVRSCEVDFDEWVQLSLPTLAPMSGT